jgi:hypothetical protein
MIAGQAAMAVKMPSTMILGYLMELCEGDGVVV